jgi:hypothetical protein
VSRFELKEDFWSPNHDGDFVDSARRWEFLGVGGSRSTQPSEAGAPGILRLTTGTSNGNSALLFAGSISSGDSLLSNLSYFSFRVRTVSTTLQVIRMGFGDDLTDGNFGANGLYFEQDTSVTGVIHRISRAASSETNTATTGSILNSGFRTFEFLRGASARWNGYIVNGAGSRSFLGSTITNIPSAAVSFGIRIETLTNAARSLDIDLMSIRSVSLARR